MFKNDQYWLNKKSKLPTTIYLLNDPSNYIPVRRKYILNNIPREAAELEESPGIDRYSKNDFDAAKFWNVMYHG